MSSRKKVGSALRFIASAGMADEDPGVVADLLRQAHQLATLVAADEGASSEARDAARGLLAVLSADTDADYDAEAGPDVG